MNMKFKAIFHIALRIEMINNENLKKCGEKFLPSAGRPTFTYSCSWDNYLSELIHLTYTFVYL